MLNKMGDCKVKLTFIGGVSKKKHGKFQGEVGGNLILLEDFQNDVKLFLDFGINVGDFYNSYPAKSNPKSIKELIKYELIPNTEDLPIENLYTTKLNNHTSNQEDPQSNLDGILISHAHRDHYLGLSFVNRNIPIYTGVTTRTIIDAFKKSSFNSTRNNFSGLNWNTFRTGEDPINIKGLEIIPVHVDHSIPAAYGFIINTSAGKIVYTGDFRMHGPLNWMTNDLLELITPKENEEGIVVSYTRVLITEGTKIKKTTIESEEIVKNGLAKLFENNPFDFILAKYDAIDWDRFRTFSEIAKKYNWKLIISEKNAYFYYILNKNAVHDTMKNPNILTDEHIYILLGGDVKYEWETFIRKGIYKNQQQHRFITYQQLKNLDEKFILHLTHFDNRLEKSLNFDLNAMFISSTIDPYAERMYDNTNSIAKKLLPYCVSTYRIHASGHVMPHDLIKFIEDVDPDILVPVHTGFPEFFTKIFKDYEIDVKCPKKNESILLD